MLLCISCAFPTIRSHGLIIVCFKFFRTSVIIIVFYPNAYMALLEFRISVSVQWDDGQPRLIGARFLAPGKLHIGCKAHLRCLKFTFIKIYIYILYTFLKVVENRYF